MLTNAFEYIYGMKITSSREKKNGFNWIVWIQAYVDFLIRVVNNPYWHEMVIIFNYSLQNFISHIMKDESSLELNFSLTFA